MALEPDDREVVEALRLMKNMGSGGTSCTEEVPPGAVMKSVLKDALHLKKSTKSHKVDKLHFMALSKNPPGILIPVAGSRDYNPGFFFA